MAIDHFDFYGRDLEWVAVDQHDCIGFFTTRGVGAVPWHVRDWHQINVGLADFFRQTPRITTAAANPHYISAIKVNRQISADPTFYVEEYLDMACRGLYCFDPITASGCPSAYEQVAHPVSPLLATTLRPEIQEQLLKFRLPNVSFLDENSIPVEKIENTSEC